jgi:hypothetical protein
VFKPKNFPARKISRPKKGQVFYPKAHALEHDLRRRSEFVAELTLIFHFSRQLFLDFSTFDRKIFRLSKFQIKKNPAVQTFRQKLVARKKFQTVRA